MGRWSGLAIEKKCSTALITNDKKHFPLRFMGNAGYQRTIFRRLRQAEQQPTLGRMGLEQVMGTAFRQVTLQSPVAFYSYKVVANAGAVTPLNLKTVPAF
jgi:hypothetical protein